MQRRCFLSGSISAFALMAAAAPERQAEGPIALPFDFEPGQLILIPVTVNGKPARAVVDTGTSVSVLDLAFAASIGVALGRSGRAAGLAGQVPVRLAHAAVDLGGRPLGLRFLAVLDLSSISPDPSRPLQMILGADFFAGRVVELDFAARRMTLWPRRSFAVPAEAPLPLVTARGVPSVPIHLGGIATLALLDLGNAGSLVIDPDFAERGRLLAGRRRSSTIVIGAEGSHEVTVATLADVALGPIDFHEVPAFMVPKLGTKVPANVGLAVMSRFHLAIDLDGKRLWLRPNLDAAATPSRKTAAA